MSAALLKKMREMGLSMDQAIELMDVWEAGEAKPVPDLSAGALRTRKWREKKEAEKYSASPGDVTETHHGDGHGDVSPTCERAQVVIPSSSLRSEDNPPETPSVSSPRKAKSTSKPTRRCPEGWSPSQRCRQQLADEGFDPGDLERALTRMRDHEFKTARSDWDATFRNWVREDRDRKPRLIHERPRSHKLDRKQANLGRALAGFDRVAGSGERP